MATYGIDVCSYQGNINWKKVKAAGCGFAVLKCIKKGLELDSKFVVNVKGCKENGIPLSVYTYVYENTVAGAEKRAKAAVKACKEQGLEGCIIWWDVEERSVFKTGASNRAKATASVIAARTIIEAAGFGFGVYCDADFYTGMLNAMDIGGRWWIAAYHGNPVTTIGQAPRYKRPTIANELCGWQFCSRGRVPGISGSVDLDIAYDDDFVSFFKPVKAEKQLSKTGNPYPIPALTVTSEKQAKKKGISSYLYSGKGVRHVQWELWRLGYDLGDAEVDGLCGAKTVAAIEAFQRDENLAVDGLAGPKTIAKLAETKSIDYKAAAVKAAKEVYPLSKGRKHGSGVQKRVKTLEQFRRQKELNCHLMTSLVQQEAKLLPEGVVVTHTAKRSGKKTIDDAVTGWKHLRHCKVVWVNKKYSDLPAEYQKAGCIYYQNSNACVNVGNGHILSCNKRVGYRYGSKSDYDRTSGYVKESNVLVVAVPLTARA